MIRAPVEGLNHRLVGCLNAIEPCRYLPPRSLWGEVDITQAGVLVDALGTGYDDYTPEQRDQVIATFPRGDDFKSEFIELQTRSALKKPTTTFGTVNLEYIECRDPTFRRPQNVCARIRNAPWHS